MSLADQWLSVDVNPETRAEIQRLVDANDTASLHERLGGRIVFGTAGLRAKMEAGFTRMNDVTVVQATQGLAEYMKTCHAELSVVVGHDHRHHSRRFAELTAAVFLLKGFKVYYLGKGLAATPLVPFSVDYYKTCGGIMITASHNPKDDNGYKVYWSNGCQIIPPHDHKIQQSILQNLEVVFDDPTWDTELVFRKHADRLVLVRNEVIHNYTQRVKQSLLKTPSFSFKAVYTAMHGVGTEFVKQAVPQDCLVYAVEQCEPDPDFPTVTFPNPEEKGALDLAVQTAEKAGLSLVVANDPDADRFSAAVKVPGGWKQLTGNELGFLFAQYVTSQMDDVSNVWLVNSTVSSQMIASMAKVEGFQFQDTLTGFKWIGNKVIDLELQGYVCPFAYEEAIGFLFSVVHDKDGISALVVFLQMYQHWLDTGKTAVDVLEEGYQKYGYFKECNGYYVVPDPEITTSIFESIRHSAKPYPATIGEFKVISWRDLTVGYDSTTPDTKPLLPVDSSSQMITVVLSTATADEVRFTARGSGTEPKLKVYIEAKSGTEAGAASLARRVWDTLRDEWFRPTVHGLLEKVTSAYEIKPKKKNHARQKWYTVVGALIALLLLVLIVRSHRPAKFTLEIENSEPAPPETSLGREATGVDEEDALPDTVELYDLMDYQGTPEGNKNGEIVLLLIPLRNAAKVLPLMFRNMMNMTYDHSLIDIAFLVSDCSEGDTTLETLFEYSQAMQKGVLLDLLDQKEKETPSTGIIGSSDLYLQYMPYDYVENVRKAYSPPYHSEYLKPFRSVQIYQKDFGQVIGQGFSDRHDVKVQGIRRKLMGRARNWLVSTALKPYHSWVYWRDVDIETSPGDILESMMRFSTAFDVIVPNVWRPLPTFLGNEQPYDLNSWMESKEGLELAKTLTEDDVIVEGYAEYPTWRVHLAYIREQDGNPDEIVDLDGVGGVSILSKAKVFRQGSNFPAFTFMNHAETEAFGKLSKKMGFRVGGLPHYTIWHIYEPSEDDLIQISRMERKKRRHRAKKGGRWSFPARLDTVAELADDKLAADTDELADVAFEVETELVFVDKVDAEDAEPVEAVEDAETVLCVGEADDMDATISTEFLSASPSLLWSRSKET